MVERSSSPVRVRFAPSPTGYMHIGNLRVAIFNWLYAKHNNGLFLLRIEDTDRERSTPEYKEAIFDAMQWMALTIDEDPVIQSEKRDRHDRLIKQLLDEGKAYRCYCTQEELDSRLKEYSKYDGYCRENVKENPSRSYVVRFKIPDNLEKIAFEDLVHGKITFERDQLDDFIIARSDGNPVYNFVVVADDADMKITHIIRGEDHISNTPKQILLYKALNFEIPKFGHLPMILNAQGHRLSKRDAVVSVLDYKKDGFLADALCNYLVRLGWAHGDQEIFTRDELIKLFSLRAVGKKNAIFNMQKLSWLNGVYIRNSDPQAILRFIIRDCDPEFLSKAMPMLLDPKNEDVINFVNLYKERSTTLIELKDQILRLLEGPNVENLNLLKDSPKELKEVFEVIINQVEAAEFLSPDFVKKIINETCEKYNFKFAQLAKPLRIALTGETSTPGVGGLFATLKKERVLKRLGGAINFLGLSK